MQLGQLIESKDALSRLAQEPLPAKTAYKLHKALKLIETEFEHYQKALAKLLERYGESHPTTQEPRISAQSPNWEAFQNEYQELLQTPVKLELPTLSIEELTCNLRAIDLVALEYLITE